MNKRHRRYIKRRFIIREQLTGYGPAADQEIPYSDQYTQFMVTERNCKSTGNFIWFSKSCVSKRGLRSQAYL